MSTVAEHAAALAAALAGQGLRVAQRAADVAPPCVYVTVRGAASADVLLAGGDRGIFGVHWIPVRGTDDRPGLYDALHKILAATYPLAVETVDLEEASVTVGDQSWPCWLGLVVMT